MTTLRRIAISTSLRVLVIDDFVPSQNYLIPTRAEDPACHIVGFASDRLRAIRNTTQLHCDASIETAVRPVSPHKTSGHSHEVQFYSNDGSFLDRCTRFMGAALANGDSVILAATLSHGNTLRQRLESDGCDVAEAIERGRYVALEPAYVLSEFLVNDQLDSARFEKSASHLIET